MTEAEIDDLNWALWGSAGGPAPYACKGCGEQIESAELCDGCAQGSDPFPHPETPHQLDCR